MEGASFCPTPRPDLGKQTILGEKGALIQILEAAVSKSFPGPLSVHEGCRPGRLGQLIGPFCSLLMRAHVHIRASYRGSLSLESFPEMLSQQGHCTLNVLG